MRALCAPEVVARGARGRVRRQRSKLRLRAPACRQRADHGHHRPGRLVPGGAAAREGLHRHGPGAGGRRGVARLQRAPARRICSCCDGELLEPETLRAAIEQVRPRELYHLAAPSFVPDSWRRPGETMAAIAGSCAADPRGGTRPSADTRVFVSGLRRDLRRRRPRARSARTRRAGRRTRTRSRSSPRTSWWERCASSRRPARELGNRLQPRVRAQARAVRDPQDHPRRGGDQPRARSSELTLGSLEAVRDWSFAGDIMHGRVADAPAGSRRRLRARERGAATRWRELARARVRVRGPGRRALRARRPELVRPPERTPSVGDPTKARERLGWQRASELRGAGGADGAGRLRSLRAAATASR